MDEKSIKEHWNDEAGKEVAAEQVTLRDLNQRQLEIDLVCKYLDKNDLVLEIGCGNGYSTKFFAEKARFIHAIDYSSQMIARANREYPNMGNVRFVVGDVLDLQYASNTFDVAVVERCLINLVSWEKQKQAITNIAAVLKPGGKLIFLEGSETGLTELNTVRINVGLPRIITVSFNQNFNEDLLLAFVRNDFNIIAIHKFGVYDFITRVVHPLLVYPEEPTYDAKINKIAATLTAKISRFDQVSRMIGLILEKKSGSLKQCTGLERIE